MAISRISPPIASAISLDEVKKHLRIDINDDDDYLNDLIDAAVMHLELVSGLKLITQSWRQYLDEMPLNGMIKLKVGPVKEIDEVRFYDGDCNPQIISPNALLLDAISSPPRLLISDLIKSGKALNGIEVDVICGFGDTASDLPDSLRRALLLLVAHNYEFRGAVPIGQMPASEPHGFRTLIAPFRRVNL